MKPGKRDRNERKEEKRIYKEVSREEWFSKAKDDDEGVEPDSGEEELLEDSDDTSGEEEESAQLEEEEPDLETLQKWVQRYDPPEAEESEDETHNTIGKVPIQWYSEYPHIGYNLDGEKILKKERKDHIQEFIDRDDDPNYWLADLLSSHEGWTDLPLPFLGAQFMMSTMIVR